MARRRSWSIPAYNNFTLCTLAGTKNPRQQNDSLQEGMASGYVQFKFVLEGETALMPY